MKIRSGFVSNSSSSSWCVLGASLGEKDIAKFKKMIAETEGRDEDDVDDYEAIEYLKCEVLKDIKHIECHSTGYCEEIHVGISSENLPEDMTIKYLKIKIAEDFKALGITGKVGWFSGESYDN